MKKTYSQKCCSRFDDCSDRGHDHRPEKCCRCWDPRRPNLWCFSCEVRKEELYLKLEKIEKELQR